ncbi:hypothetical protein NEOLI_002936 [Neolecta irregularis DAH-3]|uniref:PRISE-like Rossmann-fold domain-containing protein n=1 Tax=Neolecta irregularis (strain DAH-3) TaxID=1198029 RepID=A0A1U7LS39_NEOID|nr:hypothetical protein NEOLI_002936 [Neolecta irregularis DAH-3]|eukprot:OLL25438.1 hypothetical protein NEOLI_002936 [Neolecta irregularis DAH-3]
MVFSNSFHSDGIYHGLPDIPTTITGKSAIVCGSNGISGTHMLRVLKKSPQRWSKVYSISRRPSMEPLPDHFSHLIIDLEMPVDEIATVLKQANVQADYVFYFAYKQPAPKPGSNPWSCARELAEINGTLFNNFLNSLTVAGIKPERILLQTGTKNYGCHLGPYFCPGREEDPRIEQEPNFYYTEEDTMWKWCLQNKVDWNIAMPCVMQGTVRDGIQSIINPIGVYAAIQKVLGRKMIWPSDFTAWETEQAQSNGYLNAYLEEWAVLNPEAANEKFNATDGSYFTWARAWPRIAARYGIEWEGPSEANEGKYQVTETYTVPPPIGYGGTARVRIHSSLAAWSQEPKVRETWYKLAKEQGLPMEYIEKTDRFWFADYILAWSWPITQSMDKTRKMGFMGTCNSEEAIIDLIKECEELHILPNVLLNEDNVKD